MLYDVISATYGRRRSRAGNGNNPSAPPGIGYRVRHSRFSAAHPPPRAGPDSPYGVEPDRDSGTTAHSPSAPRHGNRYR